ncbi:MAG: polyphosphate polymerase domain-containing protein [Streptococcaceae bacterium]|jgi:SPX domain protein involved in polyphosphate accumulation|nr:polyphosphate polymerase domain-containing protein [Streptococcaceae bacterium]
MKLSNIFQRKEIKYALNYQQLEQLQKLMDKYMSADQYGQHTILSLYYDDDAYSLIKAALEKPSYREKFRIRSYGAASAEKSVFLEIKKKINGIVYKRRMAIQHQDLIHRTFTEKESQTEKEISYLFSRFDLEPKVLLAYERTAFADKETGDFRITFDENIRFRLQNLVLTNAQGQRVAPEIDVLMEVKALGAYPLWFSHALCEINAKKISFSKFATVFKRYILPNLSKKQLPEQLYLNTYKKSA